MSFLTEITTEKDIKIISACDPYVIENIGNRNGKN